MRDPSEKVVVTYLHPGMVYGGFMDSIVNLMIYDTAKHKRIVDGGGWLAVQAGSNLSGPRNGLVEKFLAYGKADWLFMVDSDMVFNPDVIEALLEYADPEHAPIVGGLCFGFNEEGEICPTLYGLDGDPDKPEELDVVRYNTWPVNTMFQVAATGAACLLIHKTALERIRDFNGGKGFNEAFPWFQELNHNGRPVGEDIAFCWRAGLAGIPVYVNTGVQIGHIKYRLLDIAAYAAQRATEETADVEG